MPPGPKFIKVHKGLRDHLPYIDPSSLKVYIALLFHTYWDEYTNGQVTITNKQLEKETGLSPDTIAKALKRLRDESKVNIFRETFGPYITYVDHGTSGKTITVLKYRNPFGEKGAAAGQTTTARRRKTKVEVEPLTDDELDAVPFD